MTNTNKMQKNKNSNNNEMQTNQTKNIFGNFVSKKEAAPSNNIFKFNIEPQTNQTSLFTNNNAHTNSLFSHFSFSNEPKNSQKNTLFNPQNEENSLNNTFLFQNEPQTNKPGNSFSSVFPQKNETNSSSNVFSFNNQQTNIFSNSPPKNQTNSSNNIYSVNNESQTKQVLNLFPKNIVPQNETNSSYRLFSNGKDKPSKDFKENESNKVQLNFNQSGFSLFHNGNNGSCFHGVKQSSSLFPTEQKTNNQTDSLFLNDMKNTNEPKNISIAPKNILGSFSSNNQMKASNQNNSIQLNNSIPFSSNNQKEDHEKIQTEVQSNNSPLSTIKVSLGQTDFLGNTVVQDDKISQNSFQGIFSSCTKIFIPENVSIHENSSKKKESNSSFMKLMKEMEKLFEKKNSIYQILDDSNTWFLEIKKITEKMKSQYIDALSFPDSEGEIYSKVSSIFKTAQADKNIKKMKRKFDIFPTFDFKVLHPAISSLHETFLKEWKTSEKDFEDDIKQIDYMHEAYYIGEYEIKILEDHSQEIEQRNYGILHYQNGNILVKKEGDIKHGVMFNKKQIYIGTYTNENNVVYFDGVIINEKNRIFIGRYNVNKQEEISGIYLTYDLEKNTFILNNSISKFSLFFDNNNDKLKCKFERDENLKYYIDFYNYIYEKEKDSKNILFYQANETSPIFMGNAKESDIVSSVKVKFYPSNLKDKANLIIYSNGDIYMGETKEEEYYIKEGFGISYLKKNKISIEGQYQDNKPYGEMCIHPINSKVCFYKGTLSEKYSPIKGEILYTNGETYQGAYGGNFHPEGEGKYTYKNGISYRGNWTNNKKDGKGFIFIDGIEYGIKVKENKLEEIQ